MESFIANKNELLLELSEAQVYFTTSINNSDIDSSIELNIDEKTVKNNDLGRLGSFVGIWRGREIPGNMDEIVGQTALSKSISKGEWANKKIKVTAPNVDLDNDTVSVGVFLKENDVTSLGAKVIVVAGRQLAPEQTSIAITNSTNRKIKVSYVIPEGIDPESRHDYLMLFKGDKPVTNNNKPLVTQAIDSNKSQGRVTLDVSNTLLEPGHYIIQYNAGRHTWDTINAAQVFTVK